MRADSAMKIASGWTVEMMSFGKSWLPNRTSKRFGFEATSFVWGQSPEAKALLALAH